MTDAPASPTYLPALLAESAAKLSPYTYGAACTPPLGHANTESKRIVRVQPAGQSHVCAESFVVHPCAEFMRAMNTRHECSARAHSTTCNTPLGAIITTRETDDPWLGCSRSTLMILLAR